MLLLTGSAVKAQITITGGDGRVLTFESMRQPGAESAPRPELAVRPVSAATTAPARGEGRVIVVQSRRQSAAEPASQPEPAVRPAPAAALPNQTTVAKPTWETPPLPPPDEPAPVPESGVVVVQVGAFRSAEGAERLTEELRRKGHAAFKVTGGNYHRVVVGPFRSQSDAVRAQSDLEQQGYEGYVRANPLP